MTTHELAQALLARDDAPVSDTLAKRVIERPNGKQTTGVCWCGCGGATKGRFVPGHDARFHALAKKVAAGEAEMPEDFVCEEAKADFLKVMAAHEQVVARKREEKAEKDAEKAARKAERDAERAARKAERDAEQGEPEGDDEPAPTRPAGGMRLIVN